MKFSVSWGRLSAFLSQGIEADIELSLESKIAVSLALLGEQTLEGSAHEFNNYFASAVSAGRSEFNQAIERLKNKIRNMRRAGLESKQQEFSIENIAFKILRRNDTLGLLNDLKIRAYDEMLKINGEEDGIQ